MFINISFLSTNTQCRPPFDRHQGLIAVIQPGCKASIPESTSREAGACFVTLVPAVVNTKAVNCRIDNVIGKHPLHWKNQNLTTP